MVVGSTDLGTLVIFGVAKLFSLDCRNSNYFVKRQDQEVEETWELVKNSRNIARHMRRMLYL